LVDDVLAVFAADVALAFAFVAVVDAVVDAVVELLDDLGFGLLDEFAGCFIGC
jgi:hypothetical protein